MKRREFLYNAAASFSMLALPSIGFASSTPLKRSIPSSEEKIPCIGMGTWITFDVGTKVSVIESRVEILKQFFALGGGMIDSSPMYGSAQAVLGKCFDQIKHPESMFSATKVWTPGEWLGIQQMQAAEELWGVKQFDLMQIHNLLDWKTHLNTLRDWKESGRIRYLGITTSHGRKHEELIKIMQTEPLDFVQFTYNITHSAAENILLPLAADKGIAVIINRPFDGGRLFHKVENKPLPEWAVEFGIQTWADYFLKFILSHPAVTVAIPATSQVEHMTENMGAQTGLLPDLNMKIKMQNVYQQI
ncbi:MAG: aldo/keto reductase [Pseudomonadota bacterium]